MGSTLSRANFCIKPTNPRSSCLLFSLCSLSAKQSSSFMNDLVSAICRMNSSFKFSASSWLWSWPGKVTNERSVLAQRSADSKILDVESIKCSVVGALFTQFMMWANDALECTLLSSLGSESHLASSSTETLSLRASSHVL
ncbi:hypothetical protein BpHYR1_022390 [Brachionus plicatilis]|uniref:Uncharacterized protein n=1 Tax=Brachionus plicatilis TaxID=10195 RepID=A0A3M7QNH1_BRAPC|nr:hypothetical protein BpHYR1_022390 [Brachionus plicatilis]